MGLGSRSAAPGLTLLLAGCAALAGPLSFLAPGLGRQPARLRAGSGGAPASAAQGAVQAERPGAGCLAAGAGVLCLAAVGLAAARRSAARPAAVRRAEADDAYGASHTSFYTDAVAKDKYDSIEEVMEKSLKDPKLQGMVKELLAACVKITEALRVNLVTVNDSSNTFGDTQLTVDVIADDLLWDLAKSSQLVCEASSEEEPEIVKTNPDGQYVLCWDPLDGSSIVDNNWAVGTIVGVWDKSTGLLGATGRDQVMSLVALYGPRTTVFMTMDDGVYEFTLGPGNQWICSREKIEIKKDCKIFAPANMRAAQEVDGYAKLIDHYMTNRYTLRYSGGLVPDVCQQFTKTQGVFTNPTSKASPAKLRLAFEAAPFGRLVEMAGGKTSDGVSGQSVLDVKIEAVDQRTALAIGSANEVDRFNETVLQKTPA
uniref:fructose-bisphosphatase n=1 Tax=Lingulaulax polyedra TaxID=160621 RepID=A3QSS0_LINPO|nr:chloroplast sedoheptulose-1,7-bisphosphatase [Lingulodinium polyedra]